jgi:hypothetical protein
MEKQCASCNQSKDISCFPKNKSRKDGRACYCKECISKKSKERRNVNPEKYRKYHCEYEKKWRAEHPEEAKQRKDKARKKLRASAKGRISTTISSRMRVSLGGSKYHRHWERLVDFTFEQLKKHLERHFRPGMTWDNYGTHWHIDHKIPVSAFNYEKPEDIDFKRCWALSNLQPLEAITNMAKSDNLSNPFQPSLTI